MAYRLWTPNADGDNGDTSEGSLIRSLSGRLMIKSCKYHIRGVVNDSGKENRLQVVRLTCPTKAWFTRGVPSRLEPMQILAWDGVVRVSISIGHGHIQYRLSCLKVPLYAILRSQKWIANSYIDFSGFREYVSILNLISLSNKLKVHFWLSAKRLNHNCQAWMIVLDI